MSAIFKKIVVTLVGLAILSGGAACSSSVSSIWTNEAEKAGFTDVTVISSEGGIVVMTGSLGDKCRLRLVADKGRSRLYVTMPGKDLSDPEAFVGDPSAALLKEDERFAACFSDSSEKQG